MTGNGVTRHGMTEHGMTEHGMTEHGMTEHGMTEHGMTGHGVTGRRRTRTGRLVAVLALAAAGTFAGAGGAQAHDTLVSTNPADGQLVEVPPHHVTLTFNEPVVALGTTVVVTGPGGVVVSTGEPELVDSDVNQYLLEQLPRGLYTVDWRVTSADSHSITGTFTFTAQNAIGLPPDATAVPGQPGDGSTAATTDEPTDETATTDAATTDAATTAATDEAASDDAATSAADGSGDSGSAQAVSPGVLVAVAGGLVALGGGVAVLLLRRPTTPGTKGTPGSDGSPPDLG